MNKKQNNVIITSVGLLVGFCSAVFIDASIKSIFPYFFGLFISGLFLIFMYRSKI